MKISDADMYARLAALFDGAGAVLIEPSGSGEEPYQVEVRLDVVDNHRRDSPDAVLRLTITINHPLFGPWNISVPIPIEGEKAGIGAAKRDLQALGDRGRFPIKLPMLVIGGSGDSTLQRSTTMLPVQFQIQLVPYRRLLPP